MVKWLLKEANSLGVLKGAKERWISWYNKLGVGVLQVSRKKLCLDRKGDQWTYFELDVLWQCRYLGISNKKPGDLES